MSAGPAAAACAWAATRRAIHVLGRPRRPAGGLRRPAAHRRQGRRAPHLGLRPLQDHAQRLGVQADLQETHRYREGRHADGSLWRPRRDGEGHHRRDQAGRPVRRRRRHRADQDRPGLPRLAAGGDLRRNEPDLDERRTAHAAHRALHGPARPGHAGLPYRGAHRQQHGARAPRAGQGRLRRQVQGLRLEDRRRRLHGRLSRPREGRRVRHL